MKLNQVNFYRQSNSQGYDESWQVCQFNDENDLSGFTSAPLVAINGQPYLRQHHVTYLTGRETCRAHHFAKHLAVQVLQSHQDTGNQAPATPDSCRVLWIDTLHGPHVSAAIYRELAAHAGDKRQLRYVCLDVLGAKRDDHYSLMRHIESLVKSLKPALVVIDDIDHFMPHCGVNVASEFSRAVRDITNHTDTAFLFIGYNHLGKKACRTGTLGNYLFTSASDIFTLSTVRDVTTVHHVCGYDLSRDSFASEFRFTIGPNNLPVEAAAIQDKRRATPIDDDTLRDIVTDIMKPGQSVTRGDFIRQVNTRHREMRQHARDTALLNQAFRLNLLIPNGEENEINTSLTLPTHLPSITTQ